METVYSFKQEVSRNFGIRWEFMHTFVAVGDIKRDTAKAVSLDFSVTYCQTEEKKAAGE